MAATLYRVQTRTDAIEGYDDVLITWAAAGRTSPVAPYADVIEGLGPGDEQLLETTVSVSGKPPLALAPGVSQSVRCLCQVGAFS
jgi:hypothetical protein